MLYRSILTIVCKGLGTVFGRRVFYWEGRTGRLGRKRGWCPSHLRLEGFVQVMEEELSSWALSRVSCVWELLFGGRVVNWPWSTWTWDWKNWMGCGWIGTEKWGCWTLQRMCLNVVCWGSDFLLFLRSIGWWFATIYRLLLRAIPMPIRHELVSLNFCYTELCLGEWCPPCWFGIRQCQVATLDCKAFQVDEAGHM